LNTPSPGLLTAEDVAHLKEWVGKAERTSDRISEARIALLAAALDRSRAPGNGELLPPLWHWLLFQTPVRQSALGTDGHARRGGFLPPVSLPRRMWAGGRLEFHAESPLRVGQEVVRDSVIRSVEYKEGRSGGLVFVSVTHVILDAAGKVALSEEQDIVYRGEPASANAYASTPAPPEPHWRREIHPEASLLFRYSAATFNAHRIHYDRVYANEVEGYPGLVVQGPLIATLLLELLHDEVRAGRLARFSFRSIAPLFDTSPFLICGDPRGGGGEVSLWAQTREGHLAMSAMAEIV
jgi:3-methylfumaryl-CoA hydratase